jgi:hypothetical protein
MFLFLLLFRFQTREYQNIGDECLKFWFYLNGPDGSNGKLNLSQQNRGSSNEIHLWSNDIYDRNWRYEQVSINGGIDPFTAIFQVTKPSQDVIIGIDDIRLTLGYCPPPTNCDFESAGLCSWTQMKDDSFDWLLQAGETISFGTGPIVGKNSKQNLDFFNTFLCFLQIIQQIPLKDIISTLNHQLPLYPMIQLESLVNIS